MRPKPVDNISFGIYLRTKRTYSGHCDIGKYKGNNIEIYHDYTDNTKLYYVSDKVRKWIKSKLVYFQEGIKKTIRSSALWTY